MQVIISGEELELCVQRGIYWKRAKTLLLADLHLGKINHFRKVGIPAPLHANTRNIELLVEVIQATGPARVVFLGDLFHSHYNTEWEVFGEVMKHFAGVSFELVTGNHDVMSEQQYLRKGIRLHDRLVMEPFVLTHHPLEHETGSYYNLAGHIHPGVRLTGKGRQSVMLPCFYFSARQGFLPAFGMFTGMARINPAKDDKIYVIADNQIISVGG